MWKLSYYNITHPFASVGTSLFVQTGYFGGLSTKVQYGDFLIEEETDGKESGNEDKKDSIKDNEEKPGKEKDEDPTVEDDQPDNDQEIDPVIEDSTKDFSTGEKLPKTATTIYL